MDRYWFFTYPKLFHLNSQEERDCWMWKRPPPCSRKPVDNGELEDGKITKKVTRRAQNMPAKAKLLKGLYSRIIHIYKVHFHYSFHALYHLSAHRYVWEIMLILIDLAEFSCHICRKLMAFPLTTPCAHNFCKACLEGAFTGKSFMRQRTCEGRRMLRAQKNVMKCPSCSTDIADFLQNPQVSLADHTHLGFDSSYNVWTWFMLNTGWTVHILSGQLLRKRFSITQACNMIITGWLIL